MKAYDQEGGYSSLVSSFLETKAMKECKAPAWRETWPPLPSPTPPPPWPPCCAILGPVPSHFRGSTALALEGGWAGLRLRKRGWHALAWLVQALGPSSAGKERAPSLSLLVAPHVPLLWSPVGVCGVGGGGGAMVWVWVSGSPGLGTSTNPKSQHYF